LRQAQDEVQNQRGALLAHLASVAALQMAKDIFVHHGPVEALQGPFFCFVEAVMSRRDATVNVLQNGRDQRVQ